MYSDQSHDSLKDWNDFAFMNFLGMINLLNQMEQIGDKPFNPNDYEIVSNNNPIYVKLG